MSQSILPTCKLIFEAYETMVALYVLLISETNPQKRKQYRASIANIRSRLDVLNDVLEDVIENAKQHHG